MERSSLKKIGKRKGGSQVNKQNAPMAFNNINDTLYGKSRNIIDKPQTISNIGVVTFRKDRLWNATTHRIHRKPLPAITSTKHCVYYKHGKRHNLHGPTYIGYKTDYALYYIDGALMHEETWNTERERYLEVGVNT